MSAKPPKLRFAGRPVVEKNGVWKIPPGLWLESLAIDKLTEETKRVWFVNTVFGDAPSFANTMPGPNGWLPIEED